MIEGKVDILVVTETRLLDSTFPASQFYICTFNKHYRLERARNIGGVLINIRKDIHSKEL